MMTVAACRGDEKLIPCRLELNMESSTYTADTLPLICGMYPGAKLFWIIGGDALLRVRQWVRAEDVLKQCSLLALNRPCEIDEAVLFTEAESIREMGGRVKIISAEASPFSSSAVRSALAEGREPEGLDLCVREIIECKGLYGRPARIPEAAEWLDRLFASLRPHRFAHSLAVASAAREMAARFGEDPLKAEKAGLLHDCAKHMPLAEMQRIAAENHLDADTDFLLRSSLLHSVVGAWVADHEYGMTDPDILEAIAYHNTGHAGMSRLAMCIALSDSIEPTREPYPMLEEIRALAQTSLEKALLLSLQTTSGFVLSRGFSLHPRTLETINWLKTLPAVRA